MDSRHRQTRSAAPDEAGVDVRSYLGALTRSRRLILATVLLITGAVLALSLVLPKTYEATATIVLEVGGGVIDQPDAETIKRRLATVDALLSSREVRDRATEEVGAAEAVSISSTVDPEANLVYVRARGRDAGDAAAMANATTESFLTVQRSLQRDSLEAAALSLQQQLEQVQSDPTATDEAAAIQQRLNELNIQISLAGSDLQLAESAEPPTEVASPRPVRNAVLALFGSLFLGILLALGRDQLRPRISSPRELSRITGSPVLAAVPYVRGGRLRRRGIVTAVEHEAYQSLRSAVQIACPPTGRHSVLITSAVHAEGKTTAAARLGLALAQAGHRSLIISADLRWPGLHERFGLPLEPGLSNVLGLIERAGVSEQMLPAIAHSVPVPGRARSQAATLDVLTSGAKPADPAQVLSSDAMGQLLRHVKGLDYRYILLDAPPMLGLADVQPLVRLVDEVVLVSRLDRITLEHVIDMQELLGRLGVTPLGSVVIGARPEASPYYVGGRQAVATADAEQYSS